MNVTQQQKLKAKAHILKPIIFIGKKFKLGAIKENIILEINSALVSHQLIKIKINTLHKNQKQQIVNEIIKASSSEVVQIIGNILVIYKRNLNKDKI